MQLKQDMKKKKKSIGIYVMKIVQHINTLKKTA